MTAKCITARRPGGREERSCLGCRKPFSSAGHHERICPRCKESEEWIAGASEFPVAPVEARTAGE